MHTRQVLALALILVSSLASGSTKCRNGNKILYLNDVCPPGYTDITAPPGAGVSTIGKSPFIQQQEQAYLAGRESDHQAYQAQVAREQAQMIQAENNRRGQCNAIEGEIRANEIAMRQINAWQVMDQLKRNHQILRDQQFQLGCGRS